MPSPSRHRLASILAVALTALLLMISVPAEAQRTPGLDETRQRVQELTQELSDAETELSDLEAATDEAAARFRTLDLESSALADVVVNSAISEFMRADEGPTMLVADDLNASRRASTLTDAAIGTDTEAMERYRSLFEDLAVARAELADATTASEAKVAALLATREELGAELARLEELERERLAEEERRRAALAKAAAQAAAASGGSGGSGGGGGATSVPANGTGTLKTCPVAGANSFIDSWGFPRSGGRRHKGVDMMASIGTPVAAPVSGTVEHRSNSVGGRSFHLNGDDGNYYYGTHLSGYGASGRVNAGDIIGYVGDDGNARGIPHLHFEIHPGGGAAVNPYPYVAAVC
ncbi:MAG: peptidoglycan DD-metalloendopeptidase family protein [Acidimicrobiales bacterium]